MKFDREHLKDELMSHYADEEEFDIHRKLEDHSRSWLKPIVIIMVLAVVAVGSYHWYQGKSVSDSTPANLTVIEAEKTPVRSKPQDPGGMVIEGGDKMVYDHISGNHKNTKQADTQEVMRVLPKTEEPMNREGLSPSDTTVAEESATASRSPVKKLDIGELPEDSEPSEEAEEKPVVEENPIKQPEVKQEVLETPVAASENTKTAKEEKTEAEERPAPAPDTSVVKPVESKPQRKPVVSQVTVKDLKKSPLPLRKGEVLTLPDPAKKRGYFIQLGSFREEKDVLQSWQTLQRNYATLLKKQSYLSEKADLGDQGIFYRLQVGPFKSEHEARAVCQDLIERKQRCFFVK